MTTCVCCELVAATTGSLVSMNDDFVGIVLDDGFFGSTTTFVEVVVISTGDAIDVDLTCSTIIDVDLTCSTIIDVDLTCSTIMDVEEDGSIILDEDLIATTAIEVVATFVFVLVVGWITTEVSSLATTCVEDDAGIDEEVEEGRIGMSTKEKGTIIRKEGKGIQCEWGFKLFLIDQVD